MRTCSANQGNCAAVSSHPLGLDSRYALLLLESDLTSYRPWSPISGDPSPQVVLHEQCHRLSPAPLPLSPYFIMLRPCARAPSDHESVRNVHLLCLRVAIVSCMRLRAKERGNREGTWGDIFASFSPQWPTAAGAPFAGHLQGTCVQRLKPVTSSNMQQSLRTKSFDLHPTDQASAVDCPDVSVASDS